MDTPTETVSKPHFANLVRTTDEHPYAVMARNRASIEEWLSLNRTFFHIPRLENEVYQALASAHPTISRHSFAGIIAKLNDNAKLPYWLGVRQIGSSHGRRNIYYTLLNTADKTQ